MDYTLEMMPIIEQVIKKQLADQQTLVVTLDLQIGACIEGGASADSATVQGLRETLVIAEATVDLFQQRLADFYEAAKAAEGERMALVKQIVAGKA